MDADEAQGWIVCAILALIGVAIFVGMIALIRIAALGACS